MRKGENEIKDCSLVATFHKSKSRSSSMRTESRVASVIFPAFKASGLVTASYSQEGVSALTWISVAFS